MTELIITIETMPVVARTLPLIEEAALQKQHGLLEIVVVEQYVLHVQQVQIVEQFVIHRPELIHQVIQNQERLQVQAKQQKVAALIQSQQTVQEVAAVLIADQVAAQEVVVPIAGQVVLPRRVADLTTGQIVHPAGVVVLAGAAVLTVAQVKAVQVDPEVPVVLQAVQEAVQVAAQEVPGVAHPEGNIIQIKTPGGLYSRF